MIEIKELSKSYGSFCAVDNINITAKNGEITVLLGPNGAGKSTTIKSIAGLLTFTGEILIDGYDNVTMDAKKSFGYIAEMPSLYDVLTIDEHIHFIGKSYKMDNYMPYAEELMTLFNLLDKRKTPCKELSKGMTQKVSMLLALMINPKSLLIDEPMMGLDPTAIEEVLNLLVRLKNNGVAILISTHVIDIIDTIWDKAYIMNKGKIVKEVYRDDLDGASLKEIFFQSVTVE